MSYSKQRLLSAFRAFLVLVAVLLPSNAEGWRSRSSRALLVTHEARTAASSGRGGSSQLAVTSVGDSPPPANVGLTASLCVHLRGGGLGGVAVTLLRTALKNPVLLFLILSSTLVVYFKESIPYDKQLLSLIELCLVAYFFYLLIVWQKMQQEAADAS